jgi:hypothetical protein
MKTLHLLLLAVMSPLASFAAPAKVLFIAGSQSHGVLQHEHRAGLTLFQRGLANTPGIVTELHTNGWVQDEKAFANAAAIVLYSSGGGGLPFLRENRLEKIGALMAKGVGFGCIHYAVEPTREKGQKEWLDWIGGAFEVHWSVNPHWDAEFKELPQHEVTRGVKPFKTNDEWYFHMRFREGMKGVTPILTAVAPQSTMGRTDGTHSGNPAVREAVKNGVPQHVMWVATRPDGGRGFGFTGGHNHLGWKNDQQRKLMLNTILWIANVPVPASGVESAVTDEDMMANLDPKTPPRPKAEPKKEDAKK